MQTNHTEPFKFGIHNEVGKTESERMPHSDTMLTMGILDEIRRQGGYVYPKGLEKVALES